MEETESYVESLILIVACDSQFCNALKRASFDGGLRIETAESLESAMEIGKEQSVCSFIVDVSLLETQAAVSFVNLIHKQSPESTCFLISDKFSSDIVCELKDESWARFVQKPVSILKFSADVVRSCKVY
jgi:DNA-binding NtrC family response regulator